MIRFLWALLTLAFAGPVAAEPAMWVVRDGDTEITLFPTVHALPKGETWLSPAVAARLDGADTLVLETIIPDDPYALAPLVAQLGTAPGLPPVARRVSAALAGSVAPAAAAAGLPVAALDRMKSWLAALTLSEATLRTLGITAASGVEPALRARAARTPLVGLETPEQQLRFLDGLPEADQVAMLEATLDDMADTREETDKLLALWRSGDVETIARDFDKESRASPRLMKTLITDRNQRWADWITGVMKRPGKVFVAVGAGHFGGPDGLLAALKARGLTVEKLQ